MNLEENFKKVEKISLASSLTEASFFDLKRLIKLLLLLLILAWLLGCLRS
jgi:flagellar biogenesis protein FliO